VPQLQPSKSSGKDSSKNQFVCRPVAAYACGFSLGETRQSVLPLEIAVSVPTKSRPPAQWPQLEEIAAELRIATGLVHQIPESRNEFWRVLSFVVASNSQRPLHRRLDSWQIAPVEHVVQFYDRDSVLLDSLAGFVGAGLTAGESAIVIATKKHITALDDRLNKSGVNVDINRLLDHYITVVADEALSKFMEHQWLDGYAFHEMVTELIDRARATGRPVRAFGEMVALLWSRGQIASTIQLERFWNSLCKEYSFSLFCAYPKGAFTEETRESFTKICAAHSRVI
jgi:hypothetical protein